LGPTLEMREIDGSVVPFQNGWPYPTGDRQKRPELSLNGAWKKFRVPGNHTMSLAARDTSVVEALRRESLEAVDPSFDDGGWTSCNVPSVENPAPDRYQDVTWYRKSFRAPADWKGRKVLLHFGAANYVADVWLNGEWLGCHEGGFTPFCFEISSKLDPAGNNVLAVRVDNIPWRPLNSDDQFKGKPGEILPYKTADWWNYGGLLRDVRLESLPSVAAMRAEIRPSKESPDGSLDVALVVRNSEARAVPTEVRWAIYPARWSSDQLTTPFAQDVARLDQLVPVPPGSAAKVELPPEGFAVAHAQLPASALEVWNLRNPVLYVLEARVMVQGQVQDTFYAQFGRRRVQSEDGRILLNGSPVFFRGVAQHEIFPGSGEAPETVDTGEAIVRQDFQNIWDLNANFVRTGHHPPHPLAPIAADRLGIALWEEIPAYWFDGASFDYQMKVRGVARQMFEELIARDFNRPSILFWGTCNECGGQKERAGFIRDLKEVASKTDGTRLVMQSAAGSDPVDKTQAECDAVGFTSYFGVFYGWPYGSATVKALEAMHAAQPKKALIATEFGIWSESDWSNIETQMLVARETWGALTSKPYVAGATWWALNDWHTMISDPQSMGLLTVDRRRKATYYVLQDLYGKRQGEAALRWSSPMQDRPIRGTVPLKWEMVSSSSGKKFSAELDGKELAPFPETTDRVFVSAINTDRLKEGEHVLTVRAENQDGLVLSQERVLFVDNVDEPPTLKVNLKDGDEILPNHLVRLRAEDDRSLKSVEVQIDDAPA
ncbi:MAG: beta galactosidase jelly roll domain-containing protein, partial [Verrucomicrobiae bacterium]|nr:beta galactosidase jelly roll domain-containing protein [Verrucomicrobiae bacterium]